MIENRGTKSHFKMYKANKRWVFAGISVVMFSSVMMYGSITANAQETTPDTETPALTLNETQDDSISTHEIRIYTSARD
ncbi:KxYKxGKxW signal peptide domain-containing protein [Paucilactobacillus nenjiangensis]